MTKDEINRTVAEKVMGLEIMDKADGIGWLALDPTTHKIITNDEDFNPAERIDHAWMVEEVIFKQDLTAKYLKALINIVHGNAVKVFSDLTIIGFWHLVHAAPEQRCKAALKAKEE